MLICSALASVAAGLGANAVAASMTAPCSTKDLSLFLQAHSSKSGLLIEAGFNHFKGAACRLTLGYTLTIQTGAAPTTRVHKIAGNPSSVKRQLTLAPKQRLSISWLWTNWCASHRSYLLNALDSARGGLIIKEAPPTCTASTKRSTLTPVR